MKTKVILLVFLLFIGRANCNEIEYPDWYCETYEDKYHFYSCGCALDKNESINNSINNISNLFLSKLNKLDNWDTFYKMAYQKYELLYHRKEGKYYFNKISINKSELVELYQIKADRVSNNINDFFAKDISPIIKYKNKDKLIRYMYTMKHYIEVLKNISNTKIDLSNYINTLNKINWYLLNTHLDLHVVCNDNDLNVFCDFLKQLFELNGIVIDDKSNNVLYVTLKNRKEFIDSIYYVNSGFIFELFYNNSLQFYDYINLQNNSKINYNEAIKKSTLELQNMIYDEKFSIFTKN